MKILYMGTPDFAVPILKALTESEHQVIGIVTQPDKPKGRGYQFQMSAVKVFALDHGIPVYQPETFKNEAFKPELDELCPDVICVAAYGKILPSYVLHQPNFGCINVHGSLLPLYRGAAPMQRAILEGQKETGVTTMQMAEGMDTGDMLEKAVVPITDEDNFETIHDKLSAAGASLLLSTLQKLVAGTIQPVPQDDSLATYAPKIEKEDCVLDFSKDARSLFNQIRALSPFPLAFTHLPDGKLLKVVSSRPSDRRAPEVAPGTVLSVGDTIDVACSGSVLSLTAVLPEGKRAMSAKDFSNGRKIAPGDILS